MRKEEEIGVMYPKPRNTKDCQQLLEDARGKNDFFLDPPKGSWSHLHIDFGFLDSGTVREHIFVISKLSSLWSFVMTTSESKCNQFG
jgi:hypothetical protein